MAEVRLLAFGRRGRSAMAEALGISPSTYNYYERNRIPPAHLLARVSDATGTRLEWLITGRGPKFASAQRDDGVDSGDANANMFTRLKGLLRSAPRLEQPLGAFVRMLEEMAGQEPMPPAGGAIPASEGLIPIIGGTAAGVARFWGEYSPGRGRVTTLERRARQVLGRNLARERQPAEVALMTTADPSRSMRSSPAALVQMRMPDGAGVVEFIDCPSVLERRRSVFGLRIDGDSMAPRYRDGDIVLLSPDESAREGQPAVVKLRGQIGATCKVYVPHGDRLHLVPVNETFPTTEHPMEAVEWALAVLWRVVLAPPP